MPQLTDAIFAGSGPFAMPLLAKYCGLQVTPEAPHLVAEFQFEDGAIVLVPIEIQAALAFAGTARTVPAVFASHAKDLPKS